MDLKTVKLGFLGSGNIAKAIGGGLIKNGIISASNVAVCAPSDRSFSDWRALKVNTTNSNNELVDFADIVFLCMKPYQFEKAMKEIKFDDNSRPSKLFVSTLAGTPMTALSSVIKENVQSSFRLIRSMPNTPLLVGEGCTALAPDKSATKEDVQIIQTIYQSVGKCQIVTENLISPAGGVAGCSPAFIYVIIEAMADAGVKGGLPRADAQTMAAQAVLGAAKMVLESGQHPAQLKDAVCSPGGSTICGIEALEKAGLRAAIMSAVDASTKRNEEMAQLYK